MGQEKKEDPDDTFEDLDVRGMAKESKGWLRAMFGEVSKASASRQLAIGGVSGWLTGYVAMKVGKMAATAIGGGMLLFQFANHKGYIRVNWTKVNKDVKKVTDRLQQNASSQAPQVLDEARRFVHENTYLATGFAGGFLIGLASS